MPFKRVASALAVGLVTVLLAGAAAAAGGGSQPWRAHNNLGIARCRAKRRGGEHRPAIEP